MLMFKKKYIKFLIILLLCIILIYHYITYHYNKKFEQASYTYYNLTTAIYNNDIYSSYTQALLLFNNHKNTIYCELACLFLSKIELTKKNITKAKYYLNQIIKNQKSSLYDIANIRLINILFKEQKYKKIIYYLNISKINKNYIYLYDTIKGDTYLALNNIDEAKKNYSQSLLNTNNKKYQFYIKKKIKNIN